MCETREICLVAPGGGANGAEVVSFAVFSWSSLGSLVFAGHGCGFSEFHVVCCNFSEMREICTIYSNSMEFSADGQESESIELMWMNFCSEFHVIRGDCG